VTFAPTSSNFFLMAAASSLFTPSLIGFGALLNQVFGFLQAEAGDLADDLDDLDLVRPDLGERDVELGLLLGGRRRTAAGRPRARHRHRHGCRGGDAELLLERLDELRELEDADALDVVDHLLLIQFCHLYLPGGPEGPPP
jgi:hypothetical protein